MRKHLVVALVVIVSGCAATAPQQGSEMTEGERLYRANCASCHALRKPANYTDEAWQSYVAKYGEKLALSPTTQKAILHYLQSHN